MTVDERIRFLLRAATRAQSEGNERIARNFRRMAEDARPVDGDGIRQAWYSDMGSLAE